MGSKPRYEHYGLCGGAIIRTSALRDAPDISAAEMRRLSAMDDRVGKWNDVTLATVWGWRKLELGVTTHKPETRTRFKLFSSHT